MKMTYLFYIIEILKFYNVYLKYVDLHKFTFSPPLLQENIHARVSTLILIIEIRCNNY